MTASRASSPAVAVAYIRVSTGRQELGPEAQRASIEAWARSAGVQVVAWHVDHLCGEVDGADRPALTEALVALRANRAGSLVVAKRDRVGRDPIVVGLIERELARRGARLVAADGNGNGSSAADAFMRTILDGVAALELAMIRQRTRDALRAKRARGERAGNVPFGFTADATGRLSPCAAEQAVIARVRQLRAAGVSLRRIVAKLARAGMVSRTGRAFALTQVAHMARSAVELTT